MAAAQTSRQRDLKFTHRLEVDTVSKLTWKPKKGPLKTTVPFKGGFAVNLGECRLLELELKPALRS